MLYTPICRGGKGYGWHLIPHPHNFCLPPQYHFSITLWRCNSPASIPTDPISQLSCPRMKRGPADGCPAHTKGQDWQVRARVITQSSLNWDMIPTLRLFVWGFQDLIWVRALHNTFQHTWSTVDLLHMQGQFESTSPRSNGQSSHKWDFRVGNEGKRACQGKW